MQRATTDDTTAPEALSGFRLALVGLIFCVSGAAALVYQVAWQRILALHSGVGIYSVAMIVGAFLAGLGLGSYLGGVFSGRSRPRTALWAFAALELCLGLFALASCHLYYDILFLKFPWLFRSLWSAGVVHFLALLFPTCLMGMSLPFLVRAAVSNPVTASRTIGYLYGLNVFGGALGALLAPWVLIRLLGVQGAVFVGAGGNFFVGLIALALAALTQPDAARPAAGAASPDFPADTEHAGSRPFGLWLALYTVSGFCALSLEILWFRVVDVAVKSNAFTFGTVLAIYLFGLATGSLVGGPLALRLRRPLQAFLLCQCALLMYSGLAVLLVTSLPADLPFFEHLVAYWKHHGVFEFGVDWNWRWVLSLYLVLPVLLYGPPTVLMGLSFAILQRAVQDDLRTTGRKVGILQAGNIVGNVAGSLLAGLLFLNLVGTIGTFKLLIAIGVAFALVGVHYYGLRTRFGVLAPALLLLVLILPSGDDFWHRLHGQSVSGALFEEDASGLAAITPTEWKLRVSINGKDHSTLPFGGVHSMLGAIPALIHPAPAEVAVIGLGSGDTAWAAGCRQETERIDVFEILTPVERVLRRATQLPLLKLPGFLADPRVAITIADGRNALALNDRRYDLIEADALRPHSAYSGNLYSREFFQLCSRRLKPGGVMCTWSPTPRVYRTFSEVFPYVVEFDGEEKSEILVGANEPLDIRVEEWIARLASERLRSYLGRRVRVNVRRSLRSARPATPASYQHLRVNRDLNPRDEFRVPYNSRIYHDTD